jgi:hypothetical protein
VGGAGTCNATLLHQPKFVTLVSSFGIIREKWLILNNFNECASESQFLLEEFLQHIRSTLLVRKREVPKKKNITFLGSNHSFPHGTLHLKGHKEEQAA